MACYEEQRQLRKEKAWLAVLDEQAQLHKPMLTRDLKRASVGPLRLRHYNVHVPSTWLCQSLVFLLPDADSQSSTASHGCLFLKIDRRPGIRGIRSETLSSACVHGLRPCQGRQARHGCWCFKDNDCSGWRAEPRLGACHHGNLRMHQAAETQGKDPQLRFAHSRGFGLGLLRLTAPSMHSCSPDTKLSASSRPGEVCLSSHLSTTTLTSHGRYEIVVLPAASDKHLDFAR